MRERRTGGTMDRNNSWRDIDDETGGLHIRDELTGVYNRAFYAAEVERVGKGRHFPVSVIMVSVDGFEEISARWGCDSGDQVLRSVARLLTSVFRVEDIVARVKRDTFVALLPATDLDGASSAVERLRQHLSDDPICMEGDRVGLSVGMATEAVQGRLEKMVQAAEARLGEDQAARRRSFLARG